MTTCAEWQTKFDEADQALHALLTGSKVASLGAGEKSITYTAATLGELQRYVAYLQSKLDECAGIRSAKKRLVQFIPEG